MVLSPDIGFDHHVNVVAWPNVWFPNLPGSGTAQPPACRAQKFSARNTRHMRALTHGFTPSHRPRPRRKVLRSLTRADLGAIRRICFRAHVCVFLRQASPTGAGKRRERDTQVGGAAGSFCPRQNRPERRPQAWPGPDVLARRAGREAAEQRRGEDACPNARQAKGLFSPATRAAEQGRP